MSAMVPDTARLGPSCGTGRSASRSTGPTAPTTWALTHGRMHEERRPLIAERDAEFALAADSP